MSEPTRRALQSIMRDTGSARLGERKPKDRTVGGDITIILGAGSTQPSDDAEAWGSATDKDPELPGDDLDDDE